MKQTISTVYHPPQTVQQQQQQQHMQKETPQKLNGFQRGSLAGRHPPPPPPPHTHTVPRLPFFRFCYEHLKHLNGISLAGRWFLDIVCWLG